MATVRQIFEHITGTLLPLINAGSNYTHNLTGAGQIKAGMVPAPGPEITPSVYVWIERSASSHAGPASLRGFRKTVRIGLAGFARPSDADGDTKEGRILAAADLLDDVEIAIMLSNRLDTGSARLAQSITLDLTAIDGAEVNSPAHGVCYGVINIVSIRERPS